MNRPIEFRVWNKQGKCFLEGADFNESYLIRGIFNLSEQVGPMLDDYSDNYILSQFTGLLDKNGKKIFEGDIVKQELQNLRHKRIEFFQVKFVNGCFIHRNNLPVSDECDRIEVVGNIFENPQLLK